MAMLNTRADLTLDGARVLTNVQALAAEWAGQRAERQRRRHLDPADFERLREAGFQLACLPIEYGGLWESHQRSSRPLYELARTLAHGDSSVALTAVMHPLVLASAHWLGSPPAPPPYTEAWEEQQRFIFRTARDGAWWGTVISESGSGGDPMLSRARARRDPAAAGADSLRYRLTGQKQFGSGSGITSYVITMAIPEGEDEPDLFFIDMRGVLDQRGVPLNDSAGVRLTAAWDGHGMTATQSHALSFEDVPATRIAWPASSRKGVIVPRALGVGFASVIVGIVEVAVETATAQLRPKRSGLRPYEQVEWSRIELEAWLIQQAYAGTLRAAEEGGKAARGGLLGKTAIAELAESVLTRICRVIGGGAYSRHSPYGFWLEDVRALGFLRPSWGLAYDRIFADSLTEDAVAS
jgi:alkylation response protein AidB-like acyl-CoA dehydrogenase